MFTYIYDTYITVASYSAQDLNKLIYRFTKIYEDTCTHKHPHFEGK